MKNELTIAELCKHAILFAGVETGYDEPDLYGVTDGKAIGTYIEKKFINHLSLNFRFEQGNSASGIDIPGLGVDIKVTSIKQPQSSCPYKSAAQKVYGIGYHLLIFVYEKFDDHEQQTGRLDMQHTLFIEKDRTGDFQTSKGVLDILDRDGNKDDVVAFLLERNLPVDDINASILADRILTERPNQGYLTVSNALQWRLQYSRVIQKAGEIEGIVRLR